jgi:hypothetical protein
MSDVRCQMSDVRCMRQAKRIVSSLAKQGESSLSRWRERAGERVVFRGEVSVDGLQLS